MKTNKFLLRNIYYFIAFGIISCHHRDESVKEISTLKIQPAQGIVFSLDTLPKPEILPLGKTETIALGKSSENPIPNYTKKIDWKVVKAGIPQTFMVGIDSISLPKVVAAIHKPIEVKKPTINIAKPPFSKEHNPFGFTIFGLNEGLIESQVHNLFQDKKGNIWFGTFNGISKYNGHTFENFTRKEGLVDNFYECGLEDHEGNIWFGFRGGLTKYDGKSFTNYTTNEGLSMNDIYSMEEDSKGNLWLGTRGNGLMKFDKDRKTFTHFGSKQGVPAIILSILVDKKGNIWLGTEGNGLLKYNSKTFEKYTIAQGLMYDSIMDLMEDPLGNIWIATWSGISKFDGTNFYHITGNHQGWTSKIVHDKHNNIWFGGLPGGLFKIDKSNTQLTTITTNEGLPDNEVLALMTDHNDNLWITTENGVAKYSKLVQSLTQTDGLINSSISCVLKDKQQNFWIGTNNGGISNIDFTTNTIKNYSVKEGLSNDNITSMLQDKAGNIWCGTLYFNLFRINKDKKTITHFRDSGDFIVCVFEDKAGNIWYSSRRKDCIFRINKNDSTITRFSVEQGLPHGNIIRIWQDSQDNMWFCTFNGVAKLDKDGKHLTTYTEIQGFNLSIVESVVEDKFGNFWFSTLDDGVTFLNVKKQTFIHFSEKEGLSSKAVFGILYDKSGNLWFNTRIGLSKLNNDFVKQLASNEPLLKPIFFKNYTSEQGYLGFGAGRFDIVEDSTGKIWIPMVDRLSIFDPKQEFNKIENPQVELKNIKLYNETINWKNDTSFVLKNGIKVKDFRFDNLSKWYNLPENLSLAYDNNYVNFEFAGINTNTPQKLIYQYKLEGIEKTWSIPSNRTEAAYGNLPSGSYTFFVKAMDGYGNWGKEISYQFSIRPPLWKTWWAFVIYLIIIIGIIRLLIKIRVEQSINRIKVLEKIRTNISADLHDDVGSILSGLAMQSQILALTSNSEQKESLLQISHMSHDAMERMRDTVWAIDSRKDKYENLIDRMRAFAEKTLNLIHVNHVFKVEIEDTKKFINPEKRQNIYLIFKEAITNISKHSDAKNVTILLKEELISIYLLIHDDGSNATIKPTDGLGLNNMKMRAKVINGIIDISFDNGFKIELTIPR